MAADEWDADSTTTTTDEEKLSEQELLNWCKSQVSKARNDRIPFERQWYINMAFFAGKQWVTWGGGAAGFDYAKLYEPPKASHTVRLTVNKIRSRMLKTIAKLNQERPRGFVQPATADDSDIAGSRAAEKIYEYVTTEQIELDEVMARCDWWSVICGTAFLKDYFDDSVEDPAGGTGLIRVDELSPFHIFVPDLETQDIERQPWVAHVCAKSVDDLKRIFGDKAKDLKATHAEGSGSVLNDKFLQGLGIAQNDAKSAVMYYEMYVKPNQRFPRGVRVCWAGDVILDVLDGGGVPREIPDALPGDEILQASGNPGPEQLALQGMPEGGGLVEPQSQVPGDPANVASPEQVQYDVAPPFINGEYPFSRRVHLMSGKFYGSSPIEDMIPLQMEYNRGRSQIIESRNRMAVPQLLAAKGSIDPRQMSSKPGLVITYQPGLPEPKPLELSPLPAYVMQDLQLSAADIDEVSSMGDIARGEAPGRVEAATALGLLLEEVDAIIGLVSRNKEVVTERVGRHILYYVHMYWDAQRTISIAGENEAFESFVFASSDVKGNTNFKIVPGSAAPLSRSAKQAFIMELMKMGAVPVAQGLKYLSMGDSAKLYEEMQIDVRQAERENVKMSKGEPCKVNPYDNHLLHIQVHDDYAKRQEFENADPQVQMINRNHVFGHLHSLAQLNGIPLQLNVSMDPMENMQATSDLLTAVQQEQAQGLYGPSTIQAELELRKIYEMIVKSGGVPPAANMGSGEQPPPQGMLPQGT